MQRFLNIVKKESRKKIGIAKQKDRSNDRQSENECPQITSLLRSGKGGGGGGGGGSAKALKVQTMNATPLKLHQEVESGIKYPLYTT